MNITRFSIILHEKIGNESLHEFVIALFDSASTEELYLTIDTVKGWFRTEKPTKSYLKQLKGKFNEARFRVFIKSRTLLNWEELMNDFMAINKGKETGVINFNSKNHDEFIECLEWQFKSILRIPIVTEYESDTLRIASNVEPVENEFHSDLKIDNMINTSTFLINFDEILKIERNRGIKIIEKWIVVSDLTIERLIISRNIDVMYRNLSMGMRLTLFLINDETQSEVNNILTLFEGYSYNIKIIELSKNPSDLNYFFVPKLGYTFYFINDFEKISPCGFEYHRFYGMSHYKAYRMHEKEVERRVYGLKKIMNI